MKSEYFWKLDLYDWSLWIDRVLGLQHKRKEDHELLMELARTNMWLFSKANGIKTETGEELTREDFYKLSYDEIKENSDKAERITGKILLQQMLERFKDKPIKNRKNGRNGPS